MLDIKKVVLKVIVRGSDRRQKKMDSFWKLKISLEERLDKALAGSVLRGIEDGESNLYDIYENEIKDLRHVILSTFSFSSCVLRALAD